jgi:hypothetical protein
MTIFPRFLSILSLSALMGVTSGSTLLAQDDRQYDPPPSDQSRQYDPQSGDQQPADRQYDSQPGDRQDDQQYDPRPDDQQYNDRYNDQRNDQTYNDQTYNGRPSPSSVNDQQDPQYGARLDPQADPRRDNQPQQPDPPSRAARLQFMSGSVSIQPNGVDDWVAGALNRPLTNSDNIWADKDSRAELSVGTGVIRLDSESSLTLTNVGENIVQLQLHQGAMNLHVRRLYDGETYEVDTQNQAFTVLKPGDYRFDVDPNADTTVITVWSGLGESTGDGPAVRVRADEQARFSKGTSLTDEIHRAPAQDGFDEWASARDGRFDHSASARYVSPDVVGSEDLDEYGTWREAPEYGNIWVPSRVDVGWSPYRNGHWIWVAPWGWTWVEDEPWGYAPFHYGRWVYYDNYWGWAPGPIYARPYYSPALVAWFGGGRWGASVGFGFGGGYGWCPLGFGEPFIPWYGVSRGYFRNVNITNTRIVNITNVYNNRYVNRGVHGGEPIHYANMRSPNGFTAVSRDTLINSRSVARNNVRVSSNELSRISTVRNPDARPTRSTMMGLNANRSAAVPPQRAFARPVVNHVTPPANSRGTFRNGSSVAGMGRNESPVAAGRNMQRPGDNIAMPPNSNVRTPDRGATYSRSVPRPPSAGGSSGYDNRGSAGRGADYTQRSNVSRPGPTGSGPASQDPRYGSRPSYSNPRVENNSRPYGQPGYDRGSSRLAPSNDRGTSSSRPSPSYGGGGYQRPAPPPSYNRPSPSNGGGGRAPAYSGSRPSSGGSSGGGRASAPPPSHSSSGGSSQHSDSHDSRGRR